MSLIPKVSCNNCDVCHQSENSLSFFPNMTKEEYVFDLIRNINQEEKNYLIFFAKHILEDWKNKKVQKCVLKKWHWLLVVDFFMANPQLLHGSFFSKSNKCLVTSECQAKFRFSTQTVKTYCLDQRKIYQHAYYDYSLVDRFDVDSIEEIELDVETNLEFLKFVSRHAHCIR